MDWSDQWAETEHDTVAVWKLGHCHSGYTFAIVRDRPNLALEIVVGEFEDEEEVFKNHFLGPLQTGDAWEAVSYQANNFYIWPWAMEPLANFTTESTLDCRVACLADYSCGSWFHYDHFCGHWSISNELLGRKRNGTVSGIERSSFV